jgi:FdrA protein
MSDTGEDTPAAARLLREPVRVINVGLEGFARELEMQGVPVVHVQWQPPAGGDEELAALLAKLGM